jgi:hypothetical protein
MVRSLQKVVIVKDKFVVVLLRFLVLRDPLVWMILMTIVTRRKAVLIVLEFANAQTAVLFDAVLFFHVPLGSNMSRLDSVVLSAGPAVMAVRL